MPEHLDSLTDSNARERLNNLVAISVALLAAFMAVTKVKDDNIVQAMLQAKSDAVDTWGEYQAKRIKHHVVELGCFFSQAEDGIRAGRVTGVQTCALPISEPVTAAPPGLVRLLGGYSMHGPGG